MMNFDIMISNATTSGDFFTTYKTRFDLSQERIDEVFYNLQGAEGRRIRFLIYKSFDSSEFSIAELRLIDYNKYLFSELWNVIIDQQNFGTKINMNQNNIVKDMVIIL